MYNLITINYLFNFLLNQQQLIIIMQLDELYLSTN